MENKELLEKILIELKEQNKTLNKIKIYTFIPLIPALIMIGLFALGLVILIISAIFSTII